MPRSGKDSAAKAGAVKGGFRWRRKRKPPVLPSALTARIFADGLVDDCMFTAGAKTVAADELAVAGTVNVLAV